MKIPLVDTWPGRAAALLVLGGIVLQALPARTRRAAAASAQMVILAPLRLAAGLADRLIGSAEENRRLSELATRLAVENARLLTLTRETNEEAYDPTLVRAPVVARDLATFQQYMVIGRGSEHGVRLAAPVLSPEGVVGKIVRVGPAQSLVECVHAPDFRVSVLNRRTDSPGLAGPGPLGALQVYFAAQDADYRVGDTLVTAGLGGVFPRGLPVGIVSQVGPGADPMLQRVVVTPFARVSHLRTALVLRLDGPIPGSDWLDNIGSPDTLIPQGGTTQ